MTQPRYPDVEVRLDPDTPSVQMLSQATAALRRAGVDEDEVRELADSRLYLDRDVMREELSKWVNVR